MDETNLLRNGGFEEGWDGGYRCHIFPTSGEPYFADVGNIFVPPGWVFWFRHNPGEWDQPEGRDAWGSFDAVRVHSGEKGWMYFTFFRKHDAGLYQQVAVEPGARVRLRAWAHAWSNHGLDGYEWCKSDPRCSAGVGTGGFFLLEGEAPALCGDPWSDAIPNFTFWVGVDPAGGTDPFAEGVVWGQGAHIYNEHAEVPEVEVVAEGDVVTVFLRSRTLWAFENNDAYWDDVALVVVGEEEPEPEPGEADGFSRLGAHVLALGEDVGEYLEVAPVVKLVGEWGLAAGLPAGTLAIGRRVSGFDAQWQYHAGLSPAKAADDFVESQLETYATNPAIVYWEGHNEPVWNDAAGMGWYAEFEVERMKGMAAMGLRCVIGNFATGTPALELWPAFLPALERAREFEAILGLHEYSCPWMWWMTGAYQVDPSEDEGDEGWTTLRYRKVYRQHLIPNGLGDVPLVITECGIDPLVSPIPAGAERGTWKQLGDFWMVWDGWRDAADFYFRQLVWYDEELQKDGYVVGATVFTWGNLGGTWADFDVAGTEVARKLIGYARERPGREWVYPGEEPEPEPEPEPGRGAPRVQYERTYVLLPPLAGADWVKAVADGAWDERRYTIGGSADDAGIGDLDVRNVIAVNPSGWGEGLELFFEEFYPGVSYRAVEAATPEGLVEVLRAGAEVEPEPGGALLVGLHDGAGGRWMVESGMTGCCLVHHAIGTTATTLDYVWLRDAGVVVVCRVNWGYADGTGTVPGEAKAGEWIEAIAETINQSRGVDYWLIGNEVNNPAEWPGGYPSPTFAVTPEYYGWLFTEIRDRVAEGRLGLAPLDPYNVVAREFGGEGDPMEWALRLYTICDPDVVCLHAKTQGADPMECWSRATFTDAPLIGRYMHLATVEDQLLWIPERLAGLPVYVTEVNPQRRRDGELGWDSDGAAWVGEACGYLRTMGRIRGAMFYRYERAGDQAGFGLEERGDVLEAIRGEEGSG